MNKEKPFETRMQGAAYKHRYCLYSQRDLSIRVSISCSLRHYQFPINAMGDFNAQDYGLLKQKQTT